MRKVPAIPVRPEAYAAGCPGLCNGLIESTAWKGSQAFLEKGPKARAFLLQGSFTPQASHEDRKLDVTAYLDLDMLIPR